MSFIPNPNLQPLKLAVKYNPPTIALFYKVNPKDKKQRRYNIFLNQLADLPNPQEITEQLYLEHPQFLNDKNVDYEQVFKMVQLLTTNLKPQNNEMNSYIDSYEDLNKSLEYENEEQLYYSSYNPRKDMQPPENQDNQLQISRVNNNNSLSLSVSGMQQFIESHHSSQKNQIPKAVSKQQPKVNQFPAQQLPMILTESTVQYQLPQQSLSLNLNNLNNRQQQQLRQQENNKNLSNFVENGSMFIDDQFYQSPAPKKNGNKTEINQQLIQNQQRYYMQNYNPQVKLYFKINNLIGWRTIIIKEIIENNLSKNMRTDFQEIQQFT